MLVNMFQTVFYRIETGGTTNSYLYPGRIITLIYNLLPSFSMLFWQNKYYFHVLVCVKKSI